MKLFITSGPNKGQVFDVAARTCTIGRAHANHVVLYDRRVSARHALIEPADGDHAIRDLGSSNGTFVNGVLATRAMLHPGDSIQVGDTVLAFERLAEPDEPDTRFRVIRDVPDQTSSVHATVKKRDSSQIVDVQAAAPNLDALQEDRRKLVALYRVNSVINSVSDTHELLCRVLEEIFDVLQAQRGFVMLLDEETGELLPAAMRRRYARDDAEQVAISRTIARQVLEDGEAVLSSDTALDQRFASADSIVAQGVRSAMCAPLHGRQGVEGIIYVDTSADAGAFRRHDLQLLVAMANELGVALENARLVDARLEGERFAAIGQAVAGLSHYIKNILGCMQGGSQMVQRALASDNTSMFRKGWDIVRRNERKISELVLDMLNYSGAGELYLEPCQVNDLVRDVAQAAGADGAKEFAVECNLDPHMPAARLDTTAVHRCLLNLLSNALEALPPSGGVVRFATCYDPQEQTLWLSVADNGCGIDPELLPTIFDVFVSTKGSKGTGLGLAVVHKLIEEHGGRVQVESTAGHGSTFTLILPLLSDAEAATPTGGSAPSPS